MLHIFFRSNQKLKEKHLFSHQDEQDHILNVQSIRKTSLKRLPTPILDFHKKNLNHALLLWSNDLLLFQKFYVMKKSMSGIYSIY